MECVKIKLEAVECDVVVKCEGVKEETGPEQHEWSSDDERQTECGVSAAAARAGLYAGHEVKGELVLGPTTLQPPDAPSAPPPPVSCEVAAWVGSGAGASPSQPRLRACSVRSERLPPAARANSAILTSATRQTNHDFKPRDRASEPYSCDACGEQFARKRSLIRHIRLHSSDSHADAEAPGSAPKAVSAERRAAPAAFAAVARPRAGDKPHQCPLYAKRFSSRSHLVVNERIHRDKPYECGICFKQFLRNSYLVDHVRIHTGETPYKCDICQKQFTQKWRLVDHVISHTGKKPYKCDICQKQFTRKSSLVRHVKSHTGENAHKCDICQKSFARDTSLSRHIRIHTTEKQYKGHICQKQCSRNSYLVNHLRIDTGETPYKCGICKKQFTQKCHLADHVRGHTGKKPYKCDICQKHFARRCNVIRHVKIHTGENPHKCNICQKPFSQKVSLIHHIRIHTGEKPYECDICQQHFTQKSSLIRHIRRKKGKNHTSDISQKQLTRKIS